MAADREDSGIMEIVAIAVLLFMFWRFYIKDKDKVIEPATTPGELKDEFARDPNFNLNDYCKDIVGNPLSTTDLTLSNLYGRGWCRRGDGSAIDEKQGFGDAYAEKQAEEYQEMKEDEALFINNKSVIQFRLINSTGSPITTDVLNTTSNPDSITGSSDPIPDPPTLSGPSNVGGPGFSANWDESTYATGYYIDVATDVSFLSLVAGYNNKDVGNNLTEAVTGLAANTEYYYRVRAYNSSGTSSNSVVGDLWTAMEIPLEATGTGNGVAMLRIESSADVDMVIDNNGYFYDDISGTTGQNQARTITGGALRVFYIKLTSGTCKITVRHENNIISWGKELFNGWGSNTNAPAYLFSSLFLLSVFGG